jgi:hypothetical protein
MKKLFNYIAAAAATLGLAACDEPTTRFAEVESVEAQRTVLLEDFTGQLCVNCPTAHELMETLQEQYGDKLICVSIHGTTSGNFGISTANGGLGTEVGEAYINDAKAIGLPAGKVNKGATIQPDEWAAAVRTAAATPAEVSLTLDATYSASTNEVSITASALSASAISDAKMQIWLLESGIVAMQRQPNGSMERNYVHNNVLRAAVNGADGEAMPLTANVYSSTTATLAIDPNWVPENLAVVAFVYTGSGVANAIRTNVTITD